MAQIAAAGGTGDEDEEPPRSERVSVALGWEFEATGAGNVDERTWMYLSDGRSVRVMWIDGDGRSRTRLIPNAVLAHVLRVQGYAVEERMEAG